MGHWRIQCWWCLAALMLLSAGRVQALELPPAPGMLLVASDTMADPRFRQTVILLVQHDRRGTTGLVLNRPVDRSSARLPRFLREVLPERFDLGLGGPVSPDTILVLLQAAQRPTHGWTILEHAQLLDLQGLASWLEERGGGSEHFRLFAGYAGWAPGQLQGELQRGDWTLLQADQKLIFATPAEKLWPLAWSLSQSLVI